MKGYTLLQEQALPEIGSHGYLYRHEKSGAIVCYLSNPNDDNKVFCISFRTPPEDDCGTTHIIEHTVLCGSDKYPLKDPFMQLDKGSMNTFLNAITGSEMTMYPIASQNDKDFHTLMDVYLDAVFHPFILKSEYPFMQEGWHYVPDPEQDTVSIQGVVFNEMKGARSDPEDVMIDMICAYLFPDNAYRFNAGGVPENIPELSYEKYLDYYKRHYQPSNSIIYLYGDGDQEELLTHLDAEYLGQMNDSGEIYDIETQAPFTAPQRVEEAYAATNDDTTFFCCTYAHGDGADATYTNCLHLLAYLLIESEGAPLREALIKQRIGDDVYSSLDTDIQKPVFSIVVKNADPEKEQLFYDTIRSTCLKLTETGFSEDELEAALNRIEFRMREGNQSSVPTGLIHMGAILNGLKRGTDPFEKLRMNEVLQKMRKAVAEGYLQQLIREIFLEETHVLQFVMRPDPELAERRESEEEERCHAYWTSLSEEQKQVLIDRHEQLLAYQAKEETQEALDSIPLLALSDISRKTEPHPYQVTQIHEIAAQVHPAASNGIAYLQFLFPLDRITVDELPYVGMLMELLGSLDTTRHTYAALTHEVDKNSGGIWMAPAFYHDTEAGCDPYYTISMKCLYSRIDQTLDLALEQILDTVFEDKDHICDILKEMLAVRDSRMNGDGDAFAAALAISHFSYSQCYANTITGLYFSDTLRELLKDYDHQIDNMIGIWKRLIRTIFTRDRMLVHITAEEKETLKIRGSLSYWLSRLPARSDRKERAPMPPLETENTAFMNASMVQYVSLAVRFPQQYSGAMQVLQNVLTGEYLWRQVRELGGAYGCRMLVTRRHILALTSFRDPHLKRTLDVYRQAQEFLKDFSIDPKEFEKYIIGTVNRLTQPMSVASRSHVVLQQWMDHITYEDRQQLRNEILDTTQEDIRKMADLLHTLAEDGAICVVGNSVKIRENEDIFDKIRPIIQGAI